MSEFNIFYAMFDFSLLLALTPEKMNKKHNSRQSLNPCIVVHSSYLLTFRSNDPKTAATAVPPMKEH